MNAEEIAEKMASRSFGTDTTIDSVSVALFNTETTMTDVRVQNPPGFAGDFLELRNGLFDTDLWSLLHKHVTFKTFYMDHLTVRLLQNGTMRPNFVYIMDNLHIAKLRPSPYEPPEFLGGKLSERRYMADTLEMRDVTLLMDAELGVSVGASPVGFAQPVKIKKVVLHGVGKKQNGISLSDLLLVVVHSLMTSAMEAAPQNLRRGIIESVEAGVQCMKSLDLDSLHLDMGSGLSDISDMMQQLGRCNQTAATPSISQDPDVKRAGAAMKQMFHQADTVGEAMSKQFNSTMEAWNHAFAGRGAPGSQQQSVDDAMNQSATAMRSAMKQANEAVSEAMNGTQKSFDEFAREAGTAMGLVPTTPPPATGDLATDERGAWNAVSGGSALPVGAGAPLPPGAAVPSGAAAPPDLLGQAEQAMGLAPQTGGAPMQPASMDPGSPTAAFTGLPEGGASGAAPPDAAPEENLPPQAMAGVAAPQMPLAPFAPAR